MLGPRGAAAALLVLGIVASGCGRQDAKTTGHAPATPSPATVAAVTPTPAAVKRPVGTDDAEGAQSFAIDDPSQLTEKAPKPGVAAKVKQPTQEQLVSPGAPTDAEIARELKQMAAVNKKSGASNGDGSIRLESDGTATPGEGTPEVVRRVIAGANAIAKFPYVYGGGHGSFQDSAYDCSGSLSYALAAGGLLDAPKTSGDLARTGEKGPGRWITIYANAGHTFMYVDGLRYDTSGRGGPLGTRWNIAPRSLKGFHVTHPPGL